MRIPLPKFVCPCCGTVITNRYVALQPLVCQNCSAQLEVKSWYANLGFWGGTALTWVACYLLGLRGTRLIVGGLIFWIPTLLLMTFVLNRIIPPPLTPLEPKDKGGGAGSGLYIR